MQKKGLIEASEVGRGGAGGGDVGAGCREVGWRWGGVGARLEWTHIDLELAEEVKRCQVERVVQEDVGGKARAHRQRECGEVQDHRRKPPACGEQ